MTHWDLARATAIASTATHAHHLPGRITLVRLARTAVFKVGDVAVKVVPAAHATHAEVMAEARLVDHLHRAGIRVPAPMWADQVGSKYTVTAYEFITHTPGALIPWGVLGQTVAALHALPVPEFLPAWTGRNPAYRQRLEDLAESGVLSADQVAHLVGLVEPITTSSTPSVINHGDLNTGNILIGDGQLTLIDWELARAAAPVMDLSGIADRARRHGASARDLADFCAGYGVPDLTSLPGVGAWGATRDVNGITYLLGCPNAADRDEGRRRLCDVLAGTSSIWVDR